MSLFFLYSQTRNAVLKTKLKCRMELGGQVVLDCKALRFNLKQVTSLASLQLCPGSLALRLCRRKTNPFIRKFIPGIKLIMTSIPTYK